MLSSDGSTSRRQLDFLRKTYLIADPHFLEIAITLIKCKKMNNNKYLNNSHIIHIKFMPGL